MVIGDTPRDVRCAKAGDAESIAVATGVFDAEALRATDADLVVETLALTTELRRFLDA